MLFIVVLFTNFDLAYRELLFRAKITPFSFLLKSSFLRTLGLLRRLQQYIKCRNPYGGLEDISILGGYAIKIQEAPYHLSYGDVCGAALIHKNWAITTAHCGTNHSYVRVGHTWRLEGSTVNILDHIIHPKYQLEHEFDYDVQLLKLLRALRFSKTVRAITISGKHKGSVLVSGWGYSKEKGEYNDTLQQVKLRIVPMEICQEVDKSWYNYTLTERMFCAGGWEYDACQGDSGGGAVSMIGQLVGLSSFGYGCGRKIPGVYTNLSEKEIREWIQIITGV